MRKIINIGTHLCRKSINRNNNVEKQPIVSISFLLYYYKNRTSLFLVFLYLLCKYVVSFFFFLCFVFCSMCVCVRMCGKKNACVKREKENKNTETTNLYLFLSCLVIQMKVERNRKRKK